MSSITIDGRSVAYLPGATVLELALANGIDIPRLCYHPALKPSGGCRLCLVEIEGRPNPAPSCGLACDEGMVVRTQSEQLTRMRRDVLELFVSEHPLDCATCAKDGACDLQTYAGQYGVPETSFNLELARTLYQDDNPFFVRDHQYCILCGKCVRVCSEIVGASAIDYAGRGFTSHISTPFDGLMVDSSCVFCSSCVQVCPTAALLPKPRIGQGREGDFTPRRTICGYCGVGCGVEFATKDGHIVYARGYRDAPANGEFLCVKGRSGWDFVTSPERLTQPLVRKDLAYQLGLTAEPWQLPAATPLKAQGRDYFVPVSWELALDLVATRLARTIAEYGPDAVAGLTSARCTNEENYLFQKFMRAGIGTNNVDHCARLCHSSSVTGLGMAFGSGAMTNPIGDIRHADCILITGSNTAESHPVISYEVVRAVNSGASLVIIDPRRVPLVDHATLWLQPAPGADIYIFLAMAHVILREGWADAAFIAARTEGFDAFAANLKEYTPEVAALHSGVPADKIELAAYLYALGRRAENNTDDNTEDWTGSEPPVRGNSTILYAMGITQRSNGTELVLCLANLALLCGQIGRPYTGVNPLRGQSNVQGACDMGGLPDVLPGYQRVTDAARRTTVAQAWGLDDLPGEPGLTVVEMMQAAVARRLRAMYVMGENPMLSDPNLSHVEEGLRTLDFLVVQDIFLSETAQLAHVVLPAAASLEKDGSITNTERRAQLLQPVVAPPGEARPDWVILVQLAQQLAAKRAEYVSPGRVRWSYAAQSDLLDEIASVTPSYRGMNYDRLAGAGLVWPCPAPDHPGTPILHREQFTRGLGKFHAVKAQLPAEQADADYPLILSTGRVLYHYHTGTMTRRSEGLDWREPRGYVEINPADGDAANLRDGGPVVIRSRRGQVRTQARFSTNVPPGVVFLSFHWKESAANLLTQDFALDPYAKIPEYKVSAVRLENPSTRGK